MPLDASILRGIRRPQMPSPIETAMQLQTFRNMGQQAEEFERQKRMNEQLDPLRLQQAEQTAETGAINLEDAKKLRQKHEIWTAVLGEETDPIRIQARFKELGQQDMATEFAGKTAELQTRLKNLSVAERAKEAADAKAMAQLAGVYVNLPPDAPELEKRAAYQKVRTDGKKYGLDILLADEPTALDDANLRVIYRAGLSIEEQAKMIKGSELSAETQEWRKFLSKSKAQHPDWTTAQHRQAFSETVYEKPETGKRPIRVSNQLVDPVTFKPVYTAPDAAAPPGAEPLSGNTPEEKLANLPKNIRGMVEGLLNYRLALPGAFALNNPKSPWNAAINAAMEIDPSWSQAEYPSRLKLYNDFKSGKAATNVRSLNTLIGHIDSLDKAAKTLDNSNWRTYNTVGNWLLAERSSGRTPAFENAATAVENEAATLFKNTGATDQEIKAWRRNLNSSMGPKDIRAAIDSMMELLGSRMNALDEQFRIGMGKPRDFHFLTDKSRSILKKFGAASVMESDTTGEQGGSGRVTDTAPQWFTVATPDGPMEFNSQVAADAFKKAHGLR